MRKSSYKPRDPSEAIEAILRDAVRRILALLRSEHDAAHRRLEAKLVRRKAMSGSTAGDRPPAALGRDRRVPTAEVADALRRLFAADNQGLRLADLRSRTGFGNMQLHRALQLLLAEGEIRRRGKDRKTEYLRTPTRPATHHRARPGGRDRKSGR